MTNCLVVLSNHEYFTVDKVDKAKLLIQHPKTDVNIEFEGKSLVQVAQLSDSVDIVEMINDNYI